MTKGGSGPSVSAGARCLWFPAPRPSEKFHSTRGSKHCRIHILTIPIPAWGFQGGNLEARGQAEIQEPGHQGEADGGGGDPVLGRDAPAPLDSARLC